MMLLASDSILVAQPLLLDIEQRRFVTGVRFAAENAQFFYDRLYTAVAAWGDLPRGMARQEEHLALFALAWALIDTGRRFHRLLWKFPEVRRFPDIMQFVDQWSQQLRKIRDAMQHPDEDFKRPMAENFVYGSMFWIDSRKRISDGLIFSHFVTAGPQANHNLEDFAYPRPVPVDTMDNIHSITLSTAGSTIDINGLMSDIKSTLIKLEDFATEAWQAVRLNPENAGDERQARLSLKAKNDIYQSVTYTVTESVDDQAVD